MILSTAHIFDRLRGLTGLDLFSQRRCAVCAGLMRRRHNHLEKNGASGWTLFLCPECRLELEALRTKEHCLTCPRPSFSAHICDYCRIDPPPWLSFSFFGRYRGLLRQLLLNYKFSGMLPANRLIQAMLLAAYDNGEKKRGGGAPALADVIAPVPMHKGRLRRRGHNHSLEMARLLAKKSRMELCPEAISRIMPTIPQTGLKKRERLLNVRDMFVADEKLVGGRHVLLVDDIMTTGATITESCKAILLAGAASVRVTVIGVTPFY